ncbi:MAG: sulfite exporter TauE/SafE family protein [Alphaproteobacteria bacterium]|nr:sulfite exporter TauE/SafE family protein [Alphaproteobacteria bacterium]
MTDPAILAAVAAAFVLAGLVKGVVGFGLPTVAMGLLGLVVAPAHAAALLIVPSLVTNAWQLAAGGPLRPLLRRLWPMLAAIALGTWLGAWAGIGLLAPAHAARASAALGVALALYAVVALAGTPRRASPRMEAATGPLVGLATGLVCAATGVSVMPSAPWLQALGLQRDALVQAMGLSFTVSTLALAATLAGGSLDLVAATVSSAALVPAAAGMMLGQRLRRRISPAVFRRALLLALLALGLWLAGRGLG